VGRAPDDGAGVHAPLTAVRALARDLPETVLRAASRHPTTQLSTALLTCAVVWGRKAPHGVANRPRIDGKDRVAGSTLVTESDQLLQGCLPHPAGRAQPAATSSFTVS
jgi:hypothetical protein